LLDTVRNVRETSISESMNEEDTVVIEEMSVEVKVTYGGANRYLCHKCHEEMERKDLTPFLEWHICDKCMR
jgi:transposase-like protein